MEKTIAELKGKLTEDVKQMVNAQQKEDEMRATIR